MTANVWALILAAGASRRLGRPKAMVQLSTGQTLLAHAIAIAKEAGLVPVVTVSLAADEIAIEAKRNGASVIDVPDAALGMSSSLRAGAAHVAADASIDGLLILLVDQWKLESADLRALLDVWAGSGRRFAAARYRGTLGVPAIFGRDHLSILASLQGDAGARDYLRDPHNRVAAVDLSNAAADVDELADLDLILKAPSL